MKVLLTLNTSLYMPRMVREMADMIRVVVLDFVSDETMSMYNWTGERSQLRIDQSEL